MFLSEWIQSTSTRHVDSPPSLFLSRPRRRRRRQERPQTRRPSPTRLRPRSRLNTMTQETTGAKTVTSPLVPCLIVSRTCTAKRIGRFVSLFYTSFTKYGRPYLSAVQDTFSFVFSCFSLEGVGLIFIPGQSFICLSLLFLSQTLDPYDRPWASTPTKIVKNLSSEEKLTKPAKGTRAAHSPLLQKSPRWRFVPDYLGVRAAECC